MADLASLYSLTQKAASIDTPPNPIETIKTANTPYGVSTDFLSFYQNVIGFINQYQKAFEEENFERMKYFVIAVSEAMIKHFKGDDELKLQLNGISEDTAKAAKDFIEKKYEESYAVEEVHDKIFEIVSEYKDKIIEKIQELTIGKDKNKSSSKKSQNVKKIKENAVTDTIVSVNEVLKKREDSYNKEIEKFSIELGSTILSKFKDIVKKINESNLKQFQKNIAGLSNAYDTQFYDVVSKLNITKNHKNTILDILGKVLKTTAVTLVNTATHSLNVIMKTVFGIAAIAKILFFWGGKVLNAVKKVISFGIKLIVGAIKLAIKGIKLIVGTAYKIVSFGVKTIANSMNTIFSLTNRLFKKVMGFSFIGLLKNSFMAFVKSYAGAFFIGYAFGRLWRMVLKVAGISDEDIAEGNYKIIDDVAMPILKSVKESVQKIKEATKELIIKFKQTKFWRTTEKIGDTIKETVQSLMGSYNLKDIWDRVNSFVENFVWPTIKALSYLLAIFGQGFIDSPTTFLRARTGAIVGLSKIAFFAKHVKLRGGIAGLLAASVVIGAGAILGTGAKKTQDEANKKYPLKHLIDKKFADLYGLEGYSETESEEYMPLVEQKRRYLGKMFEAITSATTEEEKIKRQRQYDKIRPVLVSLLEDRSEVAGLEVQLREIGAFVDDEGKDGVKYKNFDLSEYPIVKNILYKNGVWIYPKEKFKNLKTFAKQYAFLETILRGRREKIDQELATFKRLSDAKQFNELLSHDFHIEDALKFRGYEMQRPANAPLGFSNGQLSTPSSFHFNAEFEYVSPELDIPDTGVSPMMLEAIRTKVDSMLTPYSMRRLSPRPYNSLMEAYQSNTENAMQIQRTETEIRSLIEKQNQLHERLLAGYYIFSSREDDQREYRRLGSETIPALKNQLIELRRYKKKDEAGPLELVTQDFIAAANEQAKYLDLYLPAFLTNLNKLIMAFQNEFIEKLSMNDLFKKNINFITAFSGELTGKRISLLNEIQNTPSLLNEYMINKNGPDPGTDPLVIASNIFNKMIDETIISFENEYGFEFEYEINEINTRKEKWTTEVLEAVHANTELKTLRETIEAALDTYQKNKKDK